MKELIVEGAITIPDGVTIDQFTDEFIEWSKSKGYIEDFDLVFKILAAGATAAERLRIVRIPKFMIKRGGVKPYEEEK